MLPVVPSHARIGHVVCRYLRAYVCMSIRTCIGVETCFLSLSRQQAGCAAASHVSCPVFMGFYAQVDAARNTLRQSEDPLEPLNVALRKKGTREKIMLMYLLLLLLLLLPRLSVLSVFSKVQS